MAFNINNFLGGNNSINSLFSMMGNKQQSASSSILDYNTVNSTAYRKAVRAYYQQGGDQAVSESKTALNTMKNNATAMKDSALALNDKSLFEPDSDGNYKLDAIKDAVNEFVKNYNSVVENAANSDSTEALRNGVWMVNATKKNENLLAKVGITIGENNKLSFNESRLTKANISSFKSTFLGTSSFGNRMSKKAATFENIAKRSLSNSIYNKSGKYSEKLDEVKASKLNKNI